MKKIALILIILLYTKCVTAQEYNYSEWYTFVSGTFSLTGGYLYSSGGIEGTSPESPCNGCYNPSFSYFAYRTSASRLTSINTSIGVGGQTTGYCNVGFNSSFALTSAGYSETGTFGSCTVVLQVTATFSYVPKLSITDITPRNSTSDSLELKVTDIDAYSASYYNTSMPFYFQVSLDGTTWENRSSSLFTATGVTDRRKISWNNLRGSHNADWIGKELKIRVAQGAFSSTPKLFKFYNPLQISYTQTMDCPSTDAIEGSLTVNLLNAVANEDGKYYMCVTLYNVTYHSTGCTCDPFYCYNNYCKNWVEYQGPYVARGGNPWDTSHDTAFTSPSFTLHNLNPATYLLEVYNGYFRAPAYQIVTIASNNLSGGYSPPAVVGSYNGTNYHLTSCNTGGTVSTALSATGGTYYMNWVTYVPYYYIKIDNGSVGEFYLSDPVRNLSAGSHTITVTDANNCPYTFTVAINAPTPFTFNNISETGAVCNGGTGTVTCTIDGGIPNYSYSLDGGTNYSPLANDHIIGGFTQGTYSIKIKDGTSCIKDAPRSAEISQPDPLVFKAVPHAPECHDGLTGYREYISFTPAGGNPPYTITIKNIDGTQNGSSLTGLSQGMQVTSTGYSTLTAGTQYLLSIDDFKLCHKDSTNAITIPNTLEITIDNFAQSKPADCVVAANGEATFTVLNLIGAPQFLNDANSEITNISNISGNTYKWALLGVGASPQIKVKDGNCYSSLQSVTISEKSSKIAIVPEGNYAACQDVHDGSVKITVNYGVPAIKGYTYTIKEQGATEESATITPNDVYTFPDKEGNKTYSVKVEDGLGCSTAFQNVSVGLDPNRIQLQDPGAEKVNARCVDNPSGIITARRVNSTGHGSITYTLLGESITGSGGNDTYYFSGLKPKTYTVQAEDQSNTCKDTKTVVIGADPNPVTITFSEQQDQSCDEVLNGRFRISATSIGKYNGIDYGIDTIYNQTLLTKTENSTILYSGKAAVSYTFKITDKNKCTADTFYTIKNLRNNPALGTATYDSIACANDKTGVIQLHMKQKIRKTPYIFSINGVSNGTDSTFYNRTSTIDYILVTDQDDCPWDTSLQIPQIKHSIAFSQSPAFTNASCTVAKNGTITATGVNGEPDNAGYYKFKINTGDSLIGKTVTFDSLEANRNYAITVIDAKNCARISDSIPIRVIDNILRIDSVQPKLASCSEKATGGVRFKRLYGNPFPGGFKFVIKDANDQIVNYQQTNDPIITCNGLSTGRYLVTVNDTNKCSSSRSFYVDSVPLFSVNGIISKRVSKFGTPGGQIQTTINNGNAQFNFALLKANNPTDTARRGTFKDTLNIANLYGDTYILHIKDTANCIVDTLTKSIWFKETVTVVQPEKALALSVAGQHNVACFGDSTAWIRLKAEGGYREYRYSINDTNQFQRDSLFSVLKKGTYKLYVRDDARIDTAITLEITQPASPLGALSGTITPATCYGYPDGRAEISVNGGTAPYKISLDSLNWQSGPVLTGLNANTYRVLVRDSLDCFTSLTGVAVNQPEPVRVSSQNITNTPCLKSEGSIALTRVDGGHGGYSYAWYKNNELIGTQQGISNLYSGPYRLSITDVSGCKGDTTFFVSDLSNVWVNFTTTPVSCWGEANGKAELTVVNGALPLNNVHWPGTQLSLYATSELDSGLHRVVIIDNLGCQKDTMFRISTVSPIFVPEVWPYRPLCLGVDNGSLRVNATGGAGNYTYIWGSYGNGDRITNLSPGTYEVTVTDANNCSKTFNFSLSYDKVEKPSLGKDLLLCSRSDYLLNPQGYVSYSWVVNNRQASTDPVMVVTEPGTYVVNVESEEGCLGSDTVNMSFSPDEMLSDFLLTTKAYPGDTIMLVEISRPLPDSVTWILAPEAKIIDYGKYHKQISITDTGTYEFAMIAYRNGCADMVSKYVEIADPGPDGNKKSAQGDLIKSVTLYPNPNSGYFSADVILSRKADLQMRIVNLGTGVTEYLRTSKGSDVYTENFNLNVVAGIYVLYIQAGEESRTVSIVIR